MANIAAQSESYKEGIESEYRSREAALTGQQIANEQTKAQSIANAAGQVGSAVSGLVKGIDGAKTKSTPLTTNQLNLYADAQSQIAQTLEEDLAKADDEIIKIQA